MIIDSEAKSEFRKKLNELVSQTTNNILRGQYPDLAAFERQRGVIVGLGLALDLLDDKPPEPRAEDKENDEQESQ